MSDIDLPVSHIREQIAGALDLIVHMTRFADGRRAVARISAVEGLRAGCVVLQDIFAWRRGPTPGFEATGTMPSVLRLLEERDERVDPRVFAELGKAYGGARDPLDDREGPGGGNRTGRFHVPQRRRAGRLQFLSWAGPVRRLGTLLE